jgi:hypothetical protein
MVEPEAHLVKEGLDDWSQLSGCTYTPPACVQVLSRPFVLGQPSRTRKGSSAIF